MKIERINDRQIRCTLDADDLKANDLNTDEFRYGSDKVRELFVSVMERARDEVGFEAGEMPLMIEAVPTGSRTIVLLISLVDDPEELDTRFSVFGPAIDDSEEELIDPDFDSDDLDYDDGEDEPDLSGFFNLLRGIVDPDYSSLSSRFSAKLNTPSGTGRVTPRTVASHRADRKKHAEIRLFAFTSMHELGRAAASAAPEQLMFRSSLYKDQEKQLFYLSVTVPSGKIKDPAFTSLCARLAEYGDAEPAGRITEDYLIEHCEPIIRKDALKVLANM
ncbi:MAG: adaptor protein MecA [Lachnospiraceae bacterium]|nr:adaptor protein MecA [Lachnospiraceae bacterium]